MPLGLLAKDSIQDLEALARESSESLEHEEERGVEGEIHKTEPGESKEVTVLINGGGALLHHRPSSPSGSSTASSTPEQLSPQSANKDASLLHHDGGGVDTKGLEMEMGEDPVVVVADDEEDSGSGINSKSPSSRSDVGESKEQPQPQQAQQGRVPQPRSAGAATISPRASAASSSSTTYGQYSGFRADYYNQHHHHGGPSSSSATATHTSGDAHMDTGNYHAHDTYAPVILGARDEEGFHNQFFPKLIHCIFPWLPTMHDEDNDKRIGAGPRFESQTYEQETVDHSSGSASEPTTIRAVTAAEAAAAISAAPQQQQQQQGQEQPLKKPPSKSSPARSSEDDEKSSDSDALGEKLSVKERKAVLARLGLAQPDAAQTASLDGDENESSKGNKKGLLNGIPDYDPLSQNGPSEPKSILKKRTSKVDLKNQKMAKKTQGRRRSLFPSYESRHNPAALAKNVQFSPMARVVTVKSRNDMSIAEKADVWWQKTDYEDFRKAGRIITKAMLAGGSEIWLSQSESGSFRSSTPGTATETGDIIPRATGDKWWHRFGHSRRGLEHVVSVAEGRDRQINVRTAIRAVLDEQTRQKMYHREDAEKLRSVGLNHTAWARDLALAAGASDADAVRSAFAEDRKSREFYLLKMSRGNNSNTTSPNHVRRQVQHVIPNFMQPTLHHAVGALTGRLTSTQQHRLDANTAAQISYRRRQLVVTQSSSSSSSSSAAASASSSSSSNKTNAKPPSRAPESSEPIRDPNPDDATEESLAHRAAGFSVDGEKVDISAVLSGMGVSAAAAAATVAS